jgi:hypothetical protein
LLERAIEEAKRKKLGAQWMIVGGGGVTQVGSFDSLARRLSRYGACASPSRGARAAGYDAGIFVFDFAKDGS